MNNPFGLSAIIGSFEKTLRKLEKFQAENGKKINKARLELEVKEREQERAEAIANNIKEFLDVRDDAERVPE